MRGLLKRTWLLIPLWAALVSASLYARPLMPIDETRYVAVAWEMWRTGDYLVPHLNGEVYSHKPPLLFWLINAGWAAFGVQEWVARMVGPIFGLLDLFAVAVLARALWPADEATRNRVGAVLLAFPLFALYSTLLMFDTMLTFFVLVALIGLAQAARTGGWRAAGWIALGIGGGLLAKGPIALLYILPVALLAPWWSAQARTAWRPFALRLAMGLLGGIGLGLAWAFPAAIFGGPEYREAILWTQTAGRVSNSFAHERPVTFYLMFLPALLFPWLYWSPVRGILRRSVWRDEGLRFCATWAIGGFVLLCFISGKQDHYLLPLMPAVALIAARMLAMHPAPVRRPVLAASAYALFGVAGLVIAMSPFRIGTVVLNPTLVSILGAAVLVVGGLSFVDKIPRARAVVWSGATASVALLATVHALAGPGLRDVQDTREIGRELAALQAAGKPIIHSGQYHGQYTFAGRLTQPVPEATSDEELAAWCANHPDGVVIKYWEPTQNKYAGETELISPFRGRVVGLVHAHAPELKSELARRSHAAPVELGP